MYNICKSNSDIIDKIVNFFSLLDNDWFYTKMLNVKFIDNIETKQSIPDELNL